MHQLQNTSPSCVVLVLFTAPCSLSDASAHELKSNPGVGLPPHGSSGSLSQHSCRAAKEKVLEALLGAERVEEVGDRATLVLLASGFRGSRT